MDTPLYAATQRLMASHAVRAALDDLSVRIGRECDAFFAVHLAELRAARFTEHDAPAIVALVLGWILGLVQAQAVGDLGQPASAAVDPASVASTDAMVELLKIAAYAAGMSRALASSLAGADTRGVH